MKLLLSFVLVLTHYLKEVIPTASQYYFTNPYYNYYFPDYDFESQEISRPIRGRPEFADYGHGQNRENHDHWPPGFGRHNQGHGPPNHGSTYGGGGVYGGWGNWGGGRRGQDKNREPPPIASRGVQPQISKRPKPSVQPTVATTTTVATPTTVAAKTIVTTPTTVAAKTTVTTPTTVAARTTVTTPATDATTTVATPTTNDTTTVATTTINYGTGRIDIRFGEEGQRKKRLAKTADQSAPELQRYNSLHQFPNWRSPEPNFRQYSNQYPRLATCVHKKFDCIPMGECKTATYSNTQNRYCRFGYNGPYVCCERQNNVKIQSYGIKCGKKRNSGQSQAIIGGANVNADGSYPWMVAIGEILPNGSVDWYCGGALISDKTVITAAHCISRRQADVVRMGEIDLTINITDANSNLQQINTCRTLVHPLFRLPQLYNDLALLYLTTPVTFTLFVRPICLSQKSSDSDTTLAILTGWGQLSFASEQSPILQEVEVEVFNNTYCDQQYSMTQASKRNFPRGILETQLCAGDENGGKDACQGDSGAPLVAEENGDFALIGIVSAGIGCGSKVFPGVYTRVAAFTPWIFENLE